MQGTFFLIIIIKDYIHGDHIFLVASYAIFE